MRAVKLAIQTVSKFCYNRSRGKNTMREGIHPSYVECAVVCACGNAFQTRSTKASLRLDICSACHPFFTGRQKFVDTAGRVERFQKRFAKTAGAPVAKKEAAPKLAKGQKAALDKKKMKVLSSAPIKTKPLSTSKVAVKPGAPEKAAPPTKAH
jgi:large subunit ribosomal protein L31